ncbi:hypothetical protein RRG08_062257 [Elysia crispata]|uniref:Uncharacterized protein n=1 Tax=Elysia crispata TaxID=231223 RepID=A0AAE0YGK7_9GAST|nr:hypothetical protein RRG08_062257 [Elysia crispata]
MVRIVDYGNGGEGGCSGVSHSNEERGGSAVDQDNDEERGGSAVSHGDDGEGGSSSEYHDNVENGTDGLCQDSVCMRELKAYGESFSVRTQNGERICTSAKFSRSKTKGRPKGVKVFVVFGHVRFHLTTFELEIDIEELWPSGSPGLKDAMAFFCDDTASPI